MGEEVFAEFVFVHRLSQFGIPASGGAGVLKANQQGLIRFEKLHFKSATKWLFCRSRDRNQPRCRF